MPIADGRYARQERLAQLGSEGQMRLQRGSVVVIGCGALGTVSAQLLIRAGVGRVRIVDRDYVEMHNLHRQLLFDEQDAEQGLPKAEAALRKLRQVNSGIAIEAQVADVTSRNIETLIAEMALVVDGTDNFETRYLINDACVKQGKPWVYGGCVGTEGLVMSIIPGDGPCLACLFPTPPAPGSLPTCETMGVLGAASTTVAALQATEACKLLSGAQPKRCLLAVDVWNGTLRSVEVSRQDDCPTCCERQFDHLTASQTAWVTSLCGRNAVQITPAQATDLPLQRLSKTLADLGQVSFNGLLLRFSIESYEMMLFPDGRVIVKGTADEAVARSLYAKYIG